MSWLASVGKRDSEGYGFCLLIFLATALFLGFMLSACLPPWRAVLLAFVCGASVGVAEIVSRYRDEPLQASFSPFGIIYITFNGALAVGLLAVVLKYRTQLGLPSTLDSFWGALLAGFGSTALMRTRLAVIRGADNKDISIGPDIIVKTVMQMVDQYIDRARAARRLRIVVSRIQDIAKLGATDSGKSDFALAADYLLASLLAFQNLDDERKQQLRQVMSDYAQKPLPDQIKYFALGFVFLTLAGERQFEEVVHNAVTTKAAAQPKAANAQK